MTGLHKDGEDNIIMDKLKMHSLDGVARNIELIGKIGRASCRERV